MRLEFNGNGSTKAKPSFSAKSVLCRCEILQGTRINDVFTSSRSERHSPGESWDMKSKAPRSLRNSEGKGLFGCIVFILLFGVAVYLAIILGPIYYSNYSFESEVKTEISRAGARFLDDEAVLKDILDIAKRNEIQLTKDNVKLERFAGQLHVTVSYVVPVDFIFMQRNMSFEIAGSTFVGAL